MTAEIIGLYGAAICLLIGSSFIAVGVIWIVEVQRPHDATARPH